MANLRAQLLNKPPVVRPDLKCCPFCGAPPEIEYWHGGKLTKRMISCSNYDCHIRPGITGENERIAIWKWEQRHDT